MADLKLMAKCGFAVLVIVSLAILVERLTAAKYSMDLDGDLFMISTTTESIDSGLNKEFGKCLTEHSKFRYVSVRDEKILIEVDEELQSDVQHYRSTCFLPPEKCMHYLLIDLSRIMESLNVKLQLIEPSVLFCMLPPARRYNLLTRGFSRNNLRGSKNIMTFGVSEAEAEVLDKTSTRIKLISAGFSILRFPKWTDFKRRKDEENSAFETLHYFLKRHDLVIHLIVFYPRETYLWHPGLNADINATGLLFVEDGAYDNFSTSPLDLDTASTTRIYLPSDPRCFLLAMESSKFLECSNTSSDITSPSDSSMLNPEQLRNRALAAFKELKTVLGLQMVTFWLWSRTLLGWFEKCDILHYTSELELSIAVKSVKGYNFTGLFAGSECQAVKQDFNLSVDPNIELNCQGLPVKISFMYEEKYLAWYAYHDKESSYRQTFPVFEVCSTDVLGMRVNVPCDTNKIFETEFGQNWRNKSVIFNSDHIINLSTVNQINEAQML